MSVVQQHAAYNWGITDEHILTLAIFYMGNRHRQPIPFGKKRQIKFLLVAIDYFTKWVEAKPLVVIIEDKIQTFVWKNIVCWFGIPRTIISENGRQFDSRKFKEFCVELGIQNHYSSLGHPQANGQIEVTNHTLLKLIKAQLEGAKGVWPEELPRVLWAYRTTAKTPTEETPFKLAFGTEAVILAEIGDSNLRQAHYDEGTNNDELRLSLDGLAGVKDKAALRMARYQQKM